jgi:hypothetical protein
MFFTWGGFFVHMQRQASRYFRSSARGEAQNDLSAIRKLCFFQKNLENKNKACTFASIVG